MARALRPRPMKFQEVAGHECYDCGGLNYRDALRGVVSISGFGKKQRRYILRAYDRVQRYREYLRELSYVLLVTSRPSRLSKRASGLCGRAPIVRATLR